MTKAEYPYPSDEFDDIVAGPRGVHRTPRSRWSRTWPFLVVLVLFPALAYGAVTYWASDRGGSETAEGPGADASASATEDPAQTPTDTATDPAVDPPVVAPVDPPVVAPAPPDLTTPVVVFNATNRAGLAAAAATSLEDAGWTAVTSDNYDGSELATSTVLYGSPELEVTARAAATALGITTVAAAESDAIEGLEIVLEEDAP